MYRAACEEGARLWRIECHPPELTGGRDAGRAELCQAHGAIGPAHQWSKRVFYMLINVADNVSVQPCPRPSINAQLRYRIRQRIVQDPGRGTL